MANLSVSLKQFQAIKCQRCIGNVTKSQSQIFSSDLKGPNEKHYFEDSESSNDNLEASGTLRKVP